MCVHASGPEVHICHVIILVSSFPSNLLVFFWILGHVCGVASPVHRHVATLAFAARWLCSRCLLLVLAGLGALGVFSWRDFSDLHRVHLHLAAMSCVPYGWHYVDR